MSGSCQNRHVHQNLTLFTPARLHSNGNERGCVGIEYNQALLANTNPTYTPIPHNETSIVFGQICIKYSHTQIPSHLQSHYTAYSVAASTRPQFQIVYHSNISHPVNTFLWQSGQSLLDNCITLRTILIVIRFLQSEI